MVSPLVRRLRLGEMIRDLRAAADMTHEQLAAKAKVPRTDISRIELGKRKPDVGKVMKLLEALGVAEGADSWRLAIRLAMEANEKGWWDAAKFAGMSERQERCADVESGSTSIRHYHSSHIPWMFQTPEFIAARDDIWRSNGVEISPIQGVARLRRQAEVLREGGPAITVLLEEQVIRRPLVNADVMADQLRRLAQFGREVERISVRLLSVERPIGHHPVPLIPFDLHTFEDPDDGVAMLVTTHNDDLLVHDQQLVAMYVHLFEQMRDAALSEADTAASIEEHAARLAAAQ